MGLLHKPDVLRVVNLLQTFNLPVKPPVIDVATALDLMGHDKKVQKGKLRLILLQKLGKAFVTADFDMAKLTKVLHSIDEYIVVGE